MPLELDGCSAVDQAPSFRQIYGFTKIDFGHLGLKFIPPYRNYYNPYYNPYYRNSLNGGGYTRSVLDSSGRLMLVLPNVQLFSTQGIGGNGRLP